MKLDNWWRGKCKSCKWYRVEEEDTFDKGEIGAGQGYCHFEPPRVLMDPDGKAITVRPQSFSVNDCGSWQQSEDVQFQRGMEKERTE